jgi:cellulose synthase/poly-beta-1,6-N-acetylglucosamine synthase-like glycosyltransferase
VIFTERYEKARERMPTLLQIIQGLWTANPDFLQWYVAQGRPILDIVHIIFNNLFYFFLYLMVGFTSVYVILTLIVSFSKKRFKEQPFNADKAPTVTVQIPTRNEIIALKCAKHCLAFDYPKEKFNILIGDDSNDPSVTKTIQEFAANHPQIQIVRRKDNSGFKPGNLNNLLQYTTGDIIVIFDSDFTPPKDFLKRIVTPFIYDTNVAAVQAKWNFRNFNQNRITVLASSIIHVYHNIVLKFMKMHGQGSLCGSAEAIRKKDLIKLGSWKNGSLTEDIEFTLRLYKINKRIVYLPELQCYSEVPHVTNDLCKQQMRWAYGVISAYRCHIMDIIKSKKIKAKDKIISLFPGFGYLMPMLMLLLFMLGTLSFITHSPGPIDLGKFFAEMGFNFVITSGLLLTSVVALKKEKKMRYALKMLYSSFTIGLVTTYYVNKGIFKSILNKPMDWYLLKKSKNY